MLNTDDRRKKIIQRLEKASGPLTGTALAAEFAVSRQVIVGDMNIIRARGICIYATPRGYIMPSEQKDTQGLMATLACQHDCRQIESELSVIVAEGGFVRDVIVEHPVYGEIRADLMLATQADVETFVKRMEKEKAYPLLTVTGGVHLHTIEVPDQKALASIRARLAELAILAEDK